MLACPCGGGTVWSQASKLIWTPNEGEQRAGEPCSANEQPGYSSRALLAEAYGLGRKVPLQPYCAEDIAGAACTPCGLALTPYRLDVAWPSMLALATAGDGGASCFEPSAESWHVLVAPDESQFAAWTWSSSDAVVKPAKTGSPAADEGTDLWFASIGAVWNIVRRLRRRAEPHWDA